MTEIRVRSRVGRLIVLAIAVVAISSSPAVAAATSPSDSGSGFVQQAEIDADEVRMDVAVRPDGSADWTVEFWVRLDDDESEEAFESLQNDVEDDPEAYTRSFADRMSETIAASSDATGREMSGEGFEVTTERQSFAREYGVVRYSFVWHGFAAVEGDELRVDDALGGIYLDDGTRLLIGWPDGYELASVTPDPDDERDRAVMWRGGETEFVSGEPRVVVAPADAEVGHLSVAVGVGAAGVLVGVAAWWYRTRRSTGEGSLADGTGGGSSPTGARDGRSADVSFAEETIPAAESSTAGPAAATANEESKTGPPRELLSNEEQVLALLEERGGRMKQQAVVEELGWSDAKTSKVVTTLREDGELESFRIGRENVLALADEGVE